MGVTTVVPSSCAKLRKDSIGTGEEDRIGSQGIGTDKDRAEGCSQDSGA
jgi:hypothetical protein